MDSASLNAELTQHGGAAMVSKIFFIWASLINMGVLYYVFSRL